MHTHILFNENATCLRQGGKLSTPQIPSVWRFQSHFQGTSPNIQRKDTLLHCLPTFHPSIHGAARDAAARSMASLHLFSHILNFHPLPRVIKLIFHQDLIDFLLISIFFLTCFLSMFLDQFQSCLCFGPNLHC